MCKILVKQKLRTNISRYKIDSANSYYEKFADGTEKCIDEEIPFDIPNGWEWIRLGSIFQHNTGKALNGRGKGMPREYITTSNLYWNSFDLSKMKVMNFTEEELNKCIVTKGDLLVCEGGDIGRAAIWNFDYDICIQNHIHKLRPYLSLPIEYFYNVFFYYKGTGKIGGKGIGIQGLSSGSLHNILIPIPPKEEQIRIVETINKVAPIIDKYGTSQTSLDLLNTSLKERLRKSILQEAIQGKLVPQDPNDEPASVLLERIRTEKERLIKEKKIKRDKNESVIYKGDDNSYYEKHQDGTVTNLSEESELSIPDNWMLVRLGDIVYNASGLSYKKENLEEKDDNYIRVLRGGNIFDGYWETKDDDVLIGRKFVKDELILKTGTFITPAVSSFEQIGKTALIKKDTESIVVGGFVLMLLPYYIEPNLQRYLLYYFQSSVYKGLCQKMTNKSGQAFYNLSRTKLMNSCLPLPPLNEQRRIADKLDLLFTQLQ